MYSGKKRGIVGRQGMGEDTTLHPQSSVRLHKYWVHGRVAGSQVNMTYEYCRSHSLASCPPQLLTSGSELAQLLLEAFLSNTPENEWETQTDGQIDIKTAEKRQQSSRQRGTQCRWSRKRWGFQHSRQFMSAEKKWTLLAHFKQTKINERSAALAIQMATLLRSVCLQATCLITRCLLHSIFTNVLMLNVFEGCERN